jgi:7-carboxy-7-deazaguanine synthase
MRTMRISEIFLSIQGESTFAGRLCAFVRTAGCPLRCVWCDTAYAFDGGDEMPLDEIVAKVLAFGVPLVEITGGEPLAQDAAPLLMKELCDRGLSVLLETSGALNIAAADARVHVIMDIKCPGSGESGRNRWENIPLLKQTDEVKFVLAGRADYEFARDTIKAYDLASRCEVLLSAVQGGVEYKDVVRWMLADRLPARFQLQMHKHIWPPQTRGV